MADLPGRLQRQIAEIAEALNRASIPFALIGGLALASQKVVRATSDVDLLVDANRGEEADRLLAKLGYRCLHRSDEAGNHLRGDERVDLVYASRPIARRLLLAAPERATSLGALRIVSTEGVIELEVSASAKSADAPLAGDGGVRSPPATDRDPYDVLWDLMLVVEELCPVWPERGTFEGHRNFRL